MGYKINKKKVYRIMKENALSAIKKKRRYNSYKSHLKITKDNLIAQDFATTRPFEKLGTDVTMFITNYGRLYFSPIIDFHTREILAYDVSDNPDFTQTKRMLNQLKEKEYNLTDTIIHSDQGWQYKMKWYIDNVEKMNLKQSMSRKGNCLDNSPTENFFGRMKVEMFYGKSFDSLSHLIDEINRYIRYYNNDRIVTKLRMSPVKYRKKYFKKSEG